MVRKIDRDMTQVAGWACRKPVIGMALPLLHESPSSAVDSHARRLDQQTCINLFLTRCQYRGAVCKKPVNMLACKAEKMVATD
jgi:hypothetical protein